MIEKFFTTEQVASILQVHPFTILKFIKQGKLKGIKLGRVYRITESAVHDFLSERSTHGKTPDSAKTTSSSRPTVAPPVENPETPPTNDDQKAYYII